MHLQLRDLEYAVFRKHQRLHVFEEIDKRITNNEANRAEKEHDLHSKMD